MLPEMTSPATKFAAVWANMPILQKRKNLMANTLPHHQGARSISIRQPNKSNRHKSAPWKTTMTFSGLQ